MKRGVTKRRQNKRNESVATEGHMISMVATGRYIDCLGCGYRMITWQLDALRVKPSLCVQCGHPWPWSDPGPPVPTSKLMSWSAMLACGVNGCSALVKRGVQVAIDAGDDDAKRFTKAIVTMIRPARTAGWVVATSGNRIVSLCPEHNTSEHGRGLTVLDDNGRTPWGSTLDPSE